MVMEPSKKKWVTGDGFTPGGEEMKQGKDWPVLLAVEKDLCARDVRREIETYLSALHSYPTRFAEEPVSFEQHLCSMAGEHASGRSRHSG